MVGVNFAVGFLRGDGADEVYTPIETVARHVNYLVERIGPGRVGFGSDFDGAEVLRGIGDASGSRGCSRPCGRAATTTRR
jgi:membrane dipeptidase